MAETEQTPEVEVARELLKRTMDQVDEANRTLLGAANHLPREEAGKLLYAFRFALAMRLVATGIADTDLIHTVSVAMIDQIDELGRETGTSHAPLPN